MSEGPDRRRAKRRSLQWDGAVYGLDGRLVVRCRLRDVSATGMQIQLGRDQALPAAFICCMGAEGKVRRRCELVWQFSVVAGVRFTDQPDGDQG